jgi:hypothetical protein
LPINSITVDGGENKWDGWIDPEKSQAKSKAWQYPWHVKGTVQPELRWVKIGINRTAMKICIAGKCRLSCPKGHHHERSINILGGCSTF